jgi:putative ABC transport system ATP-binding protein
MAQSEYILTARGLHKSYGKGRARVEVLGGLDLSLRGGEFLAVMGPSGCGKTTLLHILGLITLPDAGTIALDGREIPAGPRTRTTLRRTHIGLVFQRLNLISVLTAADNVGISMRVRGGENNGRVEELFEALGIAHVSGRKPAEMSMGEQQRVAVARALAHRPAVLLADEPTGSLDSTNSRALLEIFRETNHRDGQTIVMITHSPDVAAYADRIVHMKDGTLLDDN